MVATDDLKLFKRVSILNPPFGYNDLKRAIPPHCFTKSLKCLLYLLSYEILLICTLYYVASNYIHTLPKVIAYIAWPFYWIYQGLTLGRLWSIGHDCSHHSFSGCVTITIMLTPILWNMMRIISLNASQIACTREIIDNPIGFVFMILFKFILEFPLYLIINYGGRKYEGLACHFYPQSVLFKDSQRPKVFLSDVGVLVFIYAYYRIMMTQGSIWVFNLYGGPWVIMCGVLLVLTYLQHTHPSVPHYDSTEWSWIRGALSTVDRDVGFMIVKNKTDNHVVHHLFPAIPSYHAHEATEAIKPILGGYYNYDGTPILKAFWREMKECVYVESDNYDDDKKKSSGVYWFRKTRQRNGLSPDSTTESTTKIPQQKQIPQLPHESTTKADSTISTTSTCFTSITRKQYHNKAVKTHKLNSKIPQTAALLDYKQSSINKAVSQQALQPLQQTLQPYQETLHHRTTNHINKHYTTEPPTISTNTTPQNHQSTKQYHNKH
ncbi:Fatty acid conjugase FAC2 B [Artemisia annua]|uniref:Fatty acid conjugase FAC2 B n=1 Tax=Artemisia annua TaxID=35608 RepID=A0A2U1P253_ARTAN|nr:Fatty acid conjugase FAC2 B [Artemisia annua]